MGFTDRLMLANGWLLKFDPSIRGDAKLYDRYMEDILKSIKRAGVKRKLQEINKYHPFLKFTIEEENENYALPFLDMLIYRIGTILHSTWYDKLTDTGLVMSYHALSPRSYK